MKSVLQILSFAAILAYLVIGLGFTSSKIAGTECNRIEINMKDSAQSGFFTRREIESRLLNGGKGLLGYPVNEINTREIEMKLLKSPYFKRADVYTNVNGVLSVDIVQRKPVVRIITRSQSSYYLDDEGFILPARGAYAPHVLVANGYFTEGSELSRAIRLDSLQNIGAYKEWFDMLELSRFIRNDKFWNSQIVQVYYNRNGDFELIPRVGAHQIILGDMTDYVTKFEKLRIFYREGLNYQGWNQYERINLKYNHQIVCTKK
jgi:cell division protein FtsQ